MTQKPLIVISAFLCLSLAGFASAYAKKIYKWTDSEGKVHYSDQPHESHPTEKVKIEPGPSKQAVQEAKQREQQLKSTAESLEQDNQQREQQRAAEQKQRDAELAREKAKKAEQVKGQNSQYHHPRYPLRPRPPNYPRPPVQPPVAVPLPSGGSGGAGRGK